jgi:hypothetical protein
MVVIEYFQCTKRGKSYNSRDMVTLNHSKIPSVVGS